jgi:hypothetical protein
MEEEGQDSLWLKDAVIMDQIPFFSRRMDSSALGRPCNLSILKIYEVWISFKVIQGGVGWVGLEMKQNWPRVNHCGSQGIGTGAHRTSLYAFDYI